jgi:hypothetical protein
LNLSFDLPLWNLPVLLGLILLLFQLGGQSQISMLVFVGLVFVLVLRSAQSYVYAGFAPMLLFLAFGGRLPMGIPPRLRRFGRWASFGYTGIYSLVFVRMLLMLIVYLTSGFPLRQARAEIRDLTKGMDQQKESIAYYWMRRPSFVVMGGSGRDWITAESSILNGNEQQLGPYEKYSGRRVTYLVFPQLGHIEKPPEQIQNGKRQYRLVHDGWTRERANILGLRLGGEAPGYNYALYKLVEPAG